MKRRVFFGVCVFAIILLTRYAIRLSQNAPAAAVQAASAAQDQTAANQQQQPLDVRGSVIHSPDGTPQLSYTLTNLSEKKVTAYTLIFEFFDNTGKPVGRGSHNNIWGLDPKPGRTGLERGESWTSHKATFIPTHLDDKSPVNYKISVDYVLFDDRSSWGPDTMKQSYQITGVQQGYAVARQQLKTMLEKEGAQAVLNAVQHGVPYNHR